MRYVKFKETNQSCSPLKISQSINAESACDRNNKSMSRCFYESKKLLSFLMYWEEKKQNIVKMYFFKVLAKFFLLTWKNCPWPIFYQMHFMKRSMICSICYITTGRLDVQFVKKILLEMANRWKKKGMIKIMVSTLNFPFICYLSRSVINVLWTSSIK